jgi:DNA helicase II / ATP-dependent DNA helicase PcrA
MTETILCPSCGRKMIKRTRRSDGKVFLGCSGFPTCRQVLECHENGSPDVQKMIDTAKGIIPKKDKFVPSAYQLAIFDWVKGEGKSLVVKALAGSGKTTTGIKMLDFVDKNLDTIYLAFNKHIAEELKTRVASHVTVMTYHALGFSGIRAAFGKVEIDNDKVKHITESLIDKYSHWGIFPQIKQLVSLVKSNLTGTEPTDLQALCERYGIETNGDQALIFQVVPQVIARCQQITNIIDFDDMCWLPIVLDLPVKKYDFIFVDEAQDTNKAQIALALMSMKDTTRIVAVGDEYQSIYGFRGADAEAIPNLIEFLGAETLPLSVTYRCPKSHVLQINRMFPEIGLEFAETSKEGIIREISNNDFLLEVRPTDMILCRCNAPLVEPAFALIRKGVKAIIRGRDIGSGLVALIRKTKSDGIEELCMKLKDYQGREVTKLESQEKFAQAQSLTDRIETIFALCDGINTIIDLEDKIGMVFSDDVEGVVFSSVHKAKGLESERVFILNKELMPHKMAKSDWEIQQERNIQYVAYTRSLNELIFVS